MGFSQNGRTLQDPRSGTSELEPSLLLACLPLLLPAMPSPERGVLPSRPLLDTTAPTVLASGAAFARSARAVLAAEPSSLCRAVMRLSSIFLSARGCFLPPVFRVCIVSSDAPFPDSNQTRCRCFCRTESSDVAGNAVDLDGLEDIYGTMGLRSLCGHRNHVSLLVGLHLTGMPTDLSRPT